MHLAVWKDSTGDHREQEGAERRFDRLTLFTCVRTDSAEQRLLTEHSLLFYTLMCCHGNSFSRGLLIKLIIGELTAFDADIQYIHTAGEKVEYRKRLKPNQKEDVRIMKLRKERNKGENIFCCWSRLRPLMWLELKGTTLWRFCGVFRSLKVCGQHKNTKVKSQTQRNLHLFDIFNWILAWKRENGYCHNQQVVRVKRYLSGWPTLLVLFSEYRPNCHFFLSSLSHWTKRSTKTHNHLAFIFSRKGYNLHYNHSCVKWLCSSLRYLLTPALICSDVNSWVEVAIVTLFWRNAMMCVEVMDNDT